MWMWQLYFFILLWLNDVFLKKMCICIRQKVDPKVWSHKRFWGNGLVKMIQLADPKFI